MKKISTIAFCLISGLTFGQQWQNKKYSYDSTLNIIYGTATNFNGGVDTLKLDIYMPKCGDSLGLSKRPLLMWIHGGAFLAGSKDDASIKNLCKQFAKRGYVTASISYRLGFISDDLSRTCNFPNYSCVFAADTAEWVRASYRAMQDGKGALRYLINRHQLYRIDTNNVFLAGESAGAFVALGMAFIDTAIEKSALTDSIMAAAKPHSQTASCVYNSNKTFASTVLRPDLGSIDGNIEPSAINYQIKAVGNMYGAMLFDYFKHGKVNTHKPAIYSFHQPCDLVVPIDSGRVYESLSWCLSNGYNCLGIANTPKIYGSRAISQWNTIKSYGYTIQDEFTTTSFPYNFLIGAGSCADQINKPCHAYDNPSLRENNLAAFFASKISTMPICDTFFKISGISDPFKGIKVMLYPNPTYGLFNLEINSNNKLAKVEVFNSTGVLIKKINVDTNLTEINLASNNPGIYFINVTIDGQISHAKIMLY